MDPMDRAYLGSWSVSVWRCHAGNIVSCPRLRLQWILLITFVSPREILRRRAKRTGTPINLMKAQSGVTLKEMSIVTLFSPFKMLATEPLVILLSLYVGFIFATIFQFFISVPVVLNLTYMFTM